MLLILHSAKSLWGKNFLLGSWGRGRWGGGGRRGFPGEQRRGGERRHLPGRERPGGQRLHQREQQHRVQRLGCQQSHTAPADGQEVRSAFALTLVRGFTKRCRLSWLTNSALVYDPKSGGGGGVAGSQPMSTAVHRSSNKLWRSNSLWFMILVD